MTSMIISYPSDDSGNLMKLLGNLGLEFTVLNQPIINILSMIYNQTLSTSNISNIVRTVIINGNNELYSELLKHGYSNFSVTSIPYKIIVPKLFASFSAFYHVKLKQVPNCCATVDESEEDDEYYSARQSPVASTTFNNDVPIFDNDFDVGDNYDYDNTESDGEPCVKRIRRHHKYGKIYCGCLQQCQMCKKHVLKERSFSSSDIVTHSFFHTKMKRYQCVTCKLGWKIQPKYHKYGCKEPRIIDILESANVPLALVKISLKCFPNAIEDLKEKCQWNF
uniref:Uncharacterized protein n=1 Tax=Panagrolaimus superbus TaxID=310955 RepID=A0A914YZX2_9BILA